MQPEPVARRAETAVGRAKVAEKSTLIHGLTIQRIAVIPVIAAETSTANPAGSAEAFLGA